MRKGGGGGGGGGRRRKKEYVEEFEGRKRGIEVNGLWVGGRGNDSQQT